MLNPINQQSASFQDAVITIRYYGGGIYFVGSVVGGLAVKAVKALKPLPSAITPTPFTGAVFFSNFLAVYAVSLIVASFALKQFDKLFPRSKDSLIMEVIAGLFVNGCLFSSGYFTYKVLTFLKFNLSTIDALSIGAVGIAALAVTFLFTVSMVAATKAIVDNILGPSRARNELAQQPRWDVV